MLGGVAIRVGPDGQIAAIVDLFEGSEVFGPIDRARGEPRSSRERNPLGGGVGISVRDPRTECQDRRDRVVTLLEKAGRIDARGESGIGEMIKE